MALRSSPRDTVTDRLEPIDKQPQYARMLEVRRALMAAKRTREAAIDIIGIENELSRPSGSARGPRADMLRERLERLRAQAAPPPHQPAPTPEGLPPEVGTALRLLKGETIAPAPDRNAKLARLRAELAIIDAGLSAVENALDLERAELSRVVAERLLARHQQIVKVMFENAAALVASVQAERRFVANVIEAGYEVRPDILRRPLMTGALRLGSQDEFNSEISIQRCALEQQGII